MENRKREVLLIAGNVLLPLLAGAVLYAIWNPDTYIGSLMCRLPGFAKLSYLGNADSGGPGILVKYYGADMAWAYAFASSIYLAARSDRRMRIRCFAACILVEILFELAQYVHFISGYFDVMDIVVEIAMNFCAYFAMKRQCPDSAEEWES